MASDPSSSVTVSSRRPASFAGRDADRTVVWLRGEHDTSTVAALSETMARAMALDDSDLVLDLSEVQFMSAATVGVISPTIEPVRAGSMTVAGTMPSAEAHHRADERTTNVAGREGP